MADKIPIQCESCGKRFQVSLETAGKMVRCPCGAVLTVPAEASDPKAAETPPAPDGDETAPSERAQEPTDESLVRKWYYARDGERFGPVPQSELQRLLEAGDVSPDEFVWTQGMEQWLPAAEVEEFRTAPADALETPDAPPDEAAEPSDEAPMPAAAPPSAPETGPTVEEPPAYRMLRVFSKAVTISGAVGFVAGLFVMAIALLVPWQVQEDFQWTLAFIAVVGLAVAVAVMAFGQLIGLIIDARRDLWHIRRTLEERDQGPEHENDT